ncbi:MAG: gluconokinase [Beutenbergiaceae bacterium]
MSVLLGLDVGTTAVKAVAYQFGAAIVADAEAGYPMLAPRPGEQIQDPDVVLAAVDQVLAEVARQLAPQGTSPSGPVPGHTLAGLSVSTAMHALIGLDRDGVPLTPVITWADTRSQAQADRLRAQGLAASLLERTGTPVHPLSPLTKAMWFSEQAQTPSVSYWVGLKDLVLAHLTGQLVTERSSASATGMYNLREGAWDQQALELADMSLAQLPPVHPTTATLPLTRDIPGLPQGLPVVLGATDGPLANLGVGAVRAGLVGLSLGTSGAVRMVVPQPTAHPSLFCYNLTDDAWLIGAAVSNGGVVLDWLARLVSADVPTLLAEAAQVVPQELGVRMVADLLSERPPAPAGTGAALTGLRLADTRGDVARAAVNGVVAKLAAIVTILDTIEPVTQVRATGGALRSPVWLAELSRVLRWPVHRFSAAGGSALGAVALGAYALGLVSNLDQAADVIGPHALGSATSGSPNA